MRRLLLVVTAFAGLASALPAQAASSLPVAASATAGTPSTGGASLLQEVRYHHRHHHHHHYHPHA